MALENSAGADVPGVSGGVVLAFLTFVNTWCFIVRRHLTTSALAARVLLNCFNRASACAQDRYIVPGAPIQFGSFVSETLHVAQAEQTFWRNITSSSFVVTFSVCSILIGHLAHHMPPFRLLSIGTCVWVLAIALSGLAYWLPKAPGTFYMFLFARAISGVGEAAFQCIVPAYIEDLAPPGQRAMWLAILYSGIPVGSALGFGYGGVLAPAPPKSIGWGWAYLLEALLMLPCAIGMAWLPTAATLRRRRAQKAAIRAPLMVRGVDVVVPLGAEGSPASSSTQPVDSDIAASAAPLSPHQPHGPAAAAEVTKPSVVAELGYLLGSPTFMLVSLGYAAFTATIGGISTIAPLLLLSLSMFADQGVASTTFGAISALGGVLGTPLGGFVTDLATRRVVAAEASDTASGALPNAWVATLREARALLGAITVMIALASVLCISASLILYAGPEYEVAFLVVLCLAITFSFATSAGITRTILLVVPVHIRPLALGTMTLLLHGLGDVPSPTVLALLVGAWAPDCSIINVNATTGAVVPMGGEPVIDPKCAANATAGHIYSGQQDGFIDAILLGSIYMLSAVVYWGCGVLVLTRRMRTETVCPPLRGAGQPCLTLDRGSVDVS